jgi:hypothetical protein
VELSTVGRWTLASRWWFSVVNDKRCPGVVLQQESEEGEVRCMEKMAEDGRGAVLTGEAEVAAAFGFKTGEVGFSGGARWTMGFVWDEDGVMRT